MQNAAIERAKEHFGNLLERQIERVTAMKESAEFVDYNALDTIKDRSPRRRWHRASNH